MRFGLRKEMILMKGKVAVFTELGRPVEFY